MADFYGGGNDDVVTGSAGSDFLYGGGGNDDITGLGGDDYLNGDQGNDTVYGGEGNDTINSNYGESTSYGGAGNDVIYASGYEEGGFQSIEGGDGEDTINVDMYGGIDYVYDPALGYETEVTINPATADIDGGSDNDDINVNIYGGSATVDGGAGDDSISVNVSASDGVTITTGTGTDTVSVGQLYNGADVVITDFTAGAGGDVMDALSILQAVSYVINPPNENPFATGHLELVQDGTSTLLVLVNDPVDMPSETQTLITFENTTATDFTGDNFSPAISPDGSPIPGETFDGTSDEDYLIGGFGGDTMLGFAGGDELDGRGGDDFVYGGEGSDNLYGGDGDDTVEGGDGNDFIDGGRGDDNITGGSGNDNIYGGGGNDTLDGGTGNDIIDTYGGDGGSDISVFGGDGDDNISIYLDGKFEYVESEYDFIEVLVDSATAIVDAGGDADQINVFINGGASEIDAGAGDDTVVVSGRQDATVTLGSGQDTVRLDSMSRYNGESLEITDFETGAGGDVFDMSPVTSLLSGTTFSDGNPYATGHLVLTQVGTDVEMILNTNPDEMNDNEAFSLVTFRNVDASDFIGANFVPPIDPDGSPLPGETIDGTSDSDYLEGTLGADLINGFGDNDDLFGGSGDDALFGGGGNDTLYGGAGFDTLTGGNGDDFLYDNRGDGVFKGNAGNDYLNIDYAYDGANRTFFGGDGDDQINANVNGLTTYDYDTNTQEITNFAKVSAYGGDGNDTININAETGTAVIDAGEGDDQINAYATEGLTITTGAGVDTVRLGGYDVETNAIITDFTTGVGGDVLSFQNLDNLLNNTDYSGGNPFETGHFVLEQVGADTHFLVVSHPDETSGDDPEVFVILEDTDASTFVVENFNPGINPAGGPISGETFTGSPDEDYFTGTIGDDTFFGDGGQDEVSGGAGNDEIYGGDGSDNLYGGNSDDFIEGGSGNDQIYGGRGSNDISGGIGNDRIESTDYDQSGADVTIDGGDGEDDIFVQVSGVFEFDYGYGYSYGGRTITDLAEVSIVGGAGNDQINFQVDAGIAEVDAGEGDDQITGFASEGLTITTGAGSDTLDLTGFGSQLASTVIITDFTTGIGGDVLEMDNILNALQGTDFQSGNPYATGHLALEQDGLDTNLVLYRNPDDPGSTDVSVLITFENADVTAFVVENFTPAINPDGSPIPGQTIEGSSDDDYLYGSIGGDTIRGFDGDDYLQGDAGDDKLIGGSGNDDLYTGFGDDTATGGAGDDRIYGGGGNDYLRGNNGNDQIEFNAFNFEGVDVTIEGGNGDDYIFVDSRSETQFDAIYGDIVLDSSDVTVDAGDGNDEIFVHAFNGTAEIDAGEGDDGITIAGVGGGATITTGAGTDRVNIAEFDIDDGVAAVITDFSAGDVFDLVSMINLLNFSDYGGGNPFATGHFALEQVGTDSHFVVRFQPENVGSDEVFTVVIFENTTVADFNAANFVPAVGPEGNPFPGEIIDGTEFGDYLEGTFGDDVISGYDDSDNIYGGLGNDALFGGEGDDYLTGGRGDDEVYGGDGNDDINSFQGDESIYGGDGADNLEAYGDGRNVLIDGGADDDQIRVNLDDLEAYDPILNDEITIATSAVTVLGGAGDDEIEVDIDNGTASIDGGIGNDVIQVEARGGLTITTGAGNDVVLIEDFAYNDDNDYIITDFLAGASGDIIVLETIFDVLDNTSFASGNPFGTGHFVLVQEGVDVRLVLNTAPETPIDSETFTLVTFENTDADDFVADNFLPQVDPAGTEVLGQTILGTSGDDFLLGNLNDDVIFGQEGEDDVIGSLGADTLYGGDDDDDIEGGLGNDKLYGDDGNDDLNGGRGDDSLYGGDGDDDLRDYAGSNIAYGGRGNDEIRLDLYGGNAGSVRGGAGADYIEVEAYDDSIIAIDAGKDDDRVYVFGEGYYDAFGVLQEAVTIEVLGKDGNDEIYALADGGSVTVDAGDGDDEINVSASEKLVIMTGAGSDIITLQGARLLEDNDYRVIDFTTGFGGDVLDLSVDDIGAFIDQLPSGIDPSEIDLFAPDIFLLDQVGNDAVLSFDLDGSTGDNFDAVVIMTFKHTDIYDFVGENFNLDYVPDQTYAFNDIFGTDDEERIDGTAEADAIYGGKGSDILRGRAGDDLLFGENGKDKLIGGGGNDILVGGGGKDELIGGNDDDFFAFFDGDTQVATNKRDVIADFTDGDRIVVQTLDADTNTVGVTEMFAFADTTAAANSVWYEVDGSNVIVNGDVDGDAVADFAIEVIGISSLDADDFLF